MSASTEVCHFWRLPLELRFHVYDLVYGRDRTIHPSLDRLLLELDFTGNRKGKPKVAPGYSKQRSTVAERRIVNNQYVSETIQHLAESNEFRLWRGFDRFGMLSPSFLRHVRSLILDWNAYSSSVKLDLNEKCPRLRRFNLKIDSYDIDVDILRNGKRPRETALRKMPLVKALSLVRGIQDFSLDDKSNSDAVDASRLTEKQNERRVRVEMLRELLRKMVTRPVGEDEKPTRGSRAAQRALKKDKEIQERRNMLNSTGVAS